MAASGEGLKYLKLWVSDEITEMHLGGETAAETGIRVRLRLIAGTGRVGRVGTLPVADGVLARLALVTLDEWLAAKEKISAGWTIESGRWLLPDILEQYEAMLDIQANASKGGRARWAKERRARRAARAARDCGKPPAGPSTAPPIEVPVEVPSRSAETSSKNGAKQEPPALPDLGVQTSATERARNAIGEQEIDGCAAALPAHCSGSAGAELEQCPLALSSYPQREPLKSSLTPASNVESAPPGRWYEAGEEQELVGLIQKARNRYPRQWDQIGDMVKRALESRAPFSVLRLALQRLLAYSARHPVAYAEKILRVEVPNYHAHAAVARVGATRAAVVGFEGVGHLIARAVQRSRSGATVQRGKASR